MKISIVIPVYNAEPYVERCLRSVFRQTYQSLELILVDDCTPDASMEVVERLRRECPSHIEMVVKRNAENSGAGVTRNNGMAAATGQYVYFMDSDDTITADCMATLVSVARQNQLPEVVFGTNSCAENPAWNAYCHFKPDVPDFTDNPAWIQQYFADEDYIRAQVANVMYRRDFLHDHGLSFRKIQHEDLDFNFQVSRVLRTVAFCRTETYSYCQNAESSTAHQTRQTDMEVMWHMTRQWIECLGPHDGQGTYRFLFKHITFWTVRRKLFDSRHPLKQLGMAFARKNKGWGRVQLTVWSYLPVIVKKLPLLFPRLRQWMFRSYILT